jgi:uncharacterized protein (TIGR03437 family)
MEILDNGVPERWSTETTRKARTRLFPAAVVIVVLLPTLVLAYKGGSPPGHAGVPSEDPSPCLASGCHEGGSNPPGGSVQIAFPGGLSYTPGVRQRWQVRINDSARNYGFETTTRLAGREEAQAGSFASVDATTGIATDGALEYVHHAVPSSTTYSFDWLPPPINVGEIIAYVAGMAANGKKDSSVYTATYRLQPAGTRPAIAVENGVVNGASFAPGICSGAWIAIYGENLAPGTRTWNASDFPDEYHLPIELDGVRVFINGKPSYVYYISPEQLNVQAPDDDALGQVEVVVETAEGPSEPVTALHLDIAPALFAFPPDGYRYVAAMHADGTLVGRPNLIPGATFRPVKADDIIQLYGTGFGPTDPAVPAGMIVDPPARLTSPVTVRIGGLNADVKWAGLVSAGLYQFNVKVPVLLDGDAPVVIEIDGMSTQAGALLTVQR